MATERSRLLASEDPGRELFRFDFDEKVYVTVGFLLEAALCSVLSWISVREGSLSSYALMTALSCLFTLAASVAFLGPRRTIAAITSPRRQSASLCFFGSALLLFYVGYVHSSDFIIEIASVAFLFGQIWYTLSYIPFSGVFARSCMSACLLMCRWNSEEDEDDEPPARRTQYSRV
ncbi:SFT2 domain containing 2 [Diplonema papillatum]|nr:SFT2 domain containing 2 [Diplonema papillatum]